MENQEDVIVTNSFAERMQSHFRESVMKPSWLKDQDLNEHDGIMGVTEEFILDESARIAGHSCTKFAWKHDQQPKMHSETKKSCDAGMF